MSKNPALVEFRLRLQWSDRPDVLELAKLWVNDVRDWSPLPRSPSSPPTPAPL